MNMYFSNMLNRATRIEIYYFVPVARDSAKKQLAKIDSCADNNPTSSLRDIMFAPPGNANFKK